MSDTGMNEPMSGDGRQQDASRAMQAPGAQLAAYRKDRGWTIEQVASQLNLAPRQIQAIESDDYTALPGMPIVRGFIRAYAKLLKIDAAPLLATMPGDTLVPNESEALRRTLPTPFSETSLPSMNDRGVSGKHIVAVLLLVLLLLAIWAVQQTGSFSGLSRSLSSRIKEDLTNLSRSTSNATQSAPANSAEAPMPVSENTAPGSIAAEAAPSDRVPPLAQEVLTTGKDALVLRVREDSWIEIKRSDNRTVFAELVKAGATETFEVKEPLTLVIGNAAGVDATLRGSPIELKASTRSNVARLSLK